MFESILTILVSAVTAAITAFLVQERKLKTELRTEFQAERAVRRLLDDSNWDSRKFETIKIQIGGFDDEELRRVLVRSGAVRYFGDDGIEYWGLLHKVKKYIA